jgi:two-component system, LytTR family, response regulator LytT
MKYLIIEDEEPAAARLQKMISAEFPDAVFLKQIVSIKSAVKWLSENQPDLIFMDIQLADGNSFEIFKLVEINCPVIFTTAFDQFAVQAFKVNSIDYLLKPVKKEELINAVKKFRVKNIQSFSEKASLEKFIDIFKTKADFQKRILIRFGDVIKAVEINNVAYFYTENKINYLVTFENKNHSIDYNLDQVESMIDPAVFFRINRQFIVNVKAISRMISYSKSRVKLELFPATEIETVVSTERSPNFKSWLTGTAFQSS